MPGFRFNKKIGPVRGVSALLDLGLDITRGANPVEAAQGEASREDQELEAAEREIQRQRELLVQKERQITRLRMRASTAGKRQREGTPSSEPELGDLPDFLILGAQKSGTTLLYYLLNQHPCVEPATKKEINYFDVNFPKGEEWYRSHFPAPTRRDGKKVMSGEASPYYLYHPHAARRAAQTVPGARLIALLRDPVERAYSEYQHRYREGRETLGFEEAVDAEGARLAGELEKMAEDESYVSPNHRKFSYLSRGIYVDQLQRWYRHFGEGQILVLESGEFFREPAGVLKRVLKFLGLPDWEPEEELLRGSAARHAGDYAPISPYTRRRLEEFFGPHNEKLYEYLGEDFGW